MPVANLKVQDAVCIRVQMSHGTDGSQVKKLLISFFFFLQPLPVLAIFLVKCVMGINFGNVTKMEVENCVSPSK